MEILANLKYVEFLHLGASIKCVPMDYGSLGNRPEEEGVLAGKFPMLSWSKDEYKNWLMMNSSSLNTSIIGATGQGVVGAGMVGLAGAILTGIFSGGIVPALRNGFSRIRFNCK